MLFRSKSLVNGTTPSPAVQVGNLINTNNGVMASVINEMKDQFYNVHNGNWTIVVPVISSKDNYGGQEKVLGFSAIQITEVKGPPDKTITGYSVGGYILPNTETGGPNYGLQATIPKLVN